MITKPSFGHFRGGSNVHHFVHGLHRTREYESLKRKGKAVPHRTNHIQDNFGTVRKDGLFTTALFDCSFEKAFFK
jgi:hypothetical protein